MILQEKYDTFKELFFDPANDQKEWFEIKSDFIKNDGKVLGAGRHGMALFHPSWGHVVKLFNEDDPYLKFIRYAYKNPSEQFPKMLDIPRRVVPNFERQGGDWLVNPYIVRMELLEPISDYEWITIETYGTLLNRIEGYISTKEQYPQLVTDELVEKYEKALKKKNRLDRRNKSLEPLYKAMEEIRKLDFGYDDIHKDNIMKRGDTYVLTDPVWDEQTSPYADANRLKDDFVDDDYAPPKEKISGGKRYPKKKYPKKIPSFRDFYDDNDDDPPF